MSGHRHAQTAPAAAVPAQSPMVATLDAFLDVLKRRNILWTLQLGTLASAVSADNLLLSAIVPVTLDGDSNVVNAQSLVGFPWGGARVVVLFVPPTGYYIVGYVGEPPVIEGKRLRLSSTTDASNTSTGQGIQIGPTNSTNLIIDNNEILVRNNGAPATLNISIAGGNLALGSSASNVDANGPFMASNEVYGNVSIVVASPPGVGTVSVTYSLTGTGSMYGGATCNTGAIGTTVLGVSVSNVSTTGATVDMYRTSNTATTVYYHFRREQ